MAKKKKIISSLSLLHSDKLVIEILNTSNEYLERHIEIKEKIEEYNWVLRSLSELIPQTIENFWSGHIFPIAEAEYELECSIVQCKLGFYKHAIISLRNVLELGLLSIYWDINDESHIDIQNWLKSIESTPFRREIFLMLKTNSYIKTFDKKWQIFERTATLYTKLSNFSHTKGFGYSSRKLNMHQSNVNNFNELSLKKWLSLMRDTVEILTIFHILKYPLALQITPVDEKFGLNGPMGGFINPHQVDRIKNIISSEFLSDLQKISDNDPHVIAMTEWVNSQPDITPDEFTEQVEKQDKNSIEMEGYDQWIKNNRKFYKFLKKSKPEEYAKQLKYFKKLRLWAKENNYLKQRNFPQNNKL
jgi:hypothetical protein